MVDLLGEAISMARWAQVAWYAWWHPQAMRPCAADGMGIDVPWVPYNWGNLKSMDINDINDMEIKS